MIATRKISLGFLIAALFLVSGRAGATPLCTASQSVYVSSGPQIFCVDATTPGTPTMLLSNSTGGSFGDIAFGPDGFLYFTDALSSKVLRIDPKSSTLLTSATLIATIPMGNTITSLAFSSSNGSRNGDLYVNASTGVFLIAGIACFGCSPSLPITPTQPITFSSPITAGGLAFDVFSKGEVETMTIVDQTNNRILQSPFPFTSPPNPATPKVLANVSKVGPGIFANFCGDTLVASGKTIDRLSFSFDVNGNLVVAESTYVNLGAAVLYFEVAADNTIFVATANDVSRVDPVTNSGVPSCSAPPTITPLASLSGANGVAIGPTSITITESFSPAVLSQTYNFGLYKLAVTFDTIYQPFDLSFKAVRSRDADISFSGFQPGTVPMHFSPLGGFAVQLVTPSPGSPGAVLSCSDTGGAVVPGPGLGSTDYGLCPTDPSAIQMKWGFSTDDSPVDPGEARANTDFLFFNPPSGSTTYSFDLTHDVWLADTTTGGKTGTLKCTYLVDNQTLMQSATVTIKSPVASCGTTTTPTCNPQFKLGQNVDFGVTLTPAPPATTLSQATIRLSIAQVEVAPDGTIQILQTINVFSKNNADTDNFFKVGSSLNNYTYNWDSSGVTPVGNPPFLFQATIFSDSFSPVVVFLTGK